LLAVGRTTLVEISASMKRQIQNSAIFLRFRFACVQIEAEFVGFRTFEVRGTATKRLQGLVFDGHFLCMSDAEVAETKDIVKNVPFEAVEKDIREYAGYAPL